MFICVSLAMHMYYESVNSSLLISSSVRPTLRPWVFGSRFSAGTSTLSIRIIPVTEALNENLPSIFGVDSRPFSLPFLSTMNPLMTPSSHLAQMISISAIGEFVILNLMKLIKFSSEQRLPCIAIKFTNFVFEKELKTYGNSVLDYSAKN